jgi:anti-sigma factor RsiW
MMTCKDVIALSPLYLSGELDSGRGAEFEEHLDVCAACARELREHKALDARLRGVIIEEPLDSAELDRRVRQSLVRPTPWRWIAAAAGVAAALVLAWLFFQVSSPIATVYADAADDHRREVVEQQARRWTSDQSAINAIAQGQGVSPSGIHAPEAGGYRLERAKLCRLNGNLYLHLVYSDGAQEFSLFLRHREQEPIAKPTNAGDRQNEHLVAFRTAALSAVVVSEQNGDALRLARLAAQAL